MKIIVIGDTAVLATRDKEIIEIEGLPVTVLGVNTGSLCIARADGEQPSTPIETIITSGTATVVGLSAGKYTYTVVWFSEEDGVDTKHEAYGTPLYVFEDDENKFNLIPAPLATSTELEAMWRGIANTLDVVVPLVDEIKNGTDVV